jgi:hypothetical protein
LYPKALLELSQIKVLDCKSELVAFLLIFVQPSKMWNWPVPPKETGKIHAVTFEVFNTFFEA